MREWAGSTGYRWGQKGAEAFLELRALRTSSEVEANFTFQLDRARQRLHASHCANGVLPGAT